MRGVVMFIAVLPYGLADSWVFIPENFLHISMKMHISNVKIVNNVCVRPDESMKYLKRGESRAVVGEMSVSLLFFLLGLSFEGRL